MRVKLQLQDYFGITDKRKICFLIKEDECRKVTDLCYLIYKQYYENKSTFGKVALYLDGFYIPPQEDIGIIQHDDVLMVKFINSCVESSGYEANDTNKRKKVNETSSSDCSSSDTNSPQKKIPKSLPQNKNAKKVTKENKTVVVKNNPPKKLPLSKLSYTKEASSSSDDSSSSSSDSDTLQKKVAKIVQSKNITNGKSKQAESIKVKKSKSSSSDTTSTDSSSSSDEEVNITKKIAKKPVKNNKEDCIIINEATKDQKLNSKKEKNVPSVQRKSVDFNISNLPKGSTSTPFPLTPFPKPNFKIPSNIQRSNENKKQKSNFKKDAKLVTSKDVYRNSSTIILNDSSLPYSDNSEQSANFTPLSKIRSFGSANESSSKVFNSSNESSLNASDTSGVSGKTLRNRRRRQRKAELTKKQQVNGEKEVTKDYGEEPTKDYVNIQNDIRSQESKEVKENGVTEEAESQNMETSESLMNTDEMFTDILEKPAITTVEDFTKFPLLTELPTEGAVILFKMLEMSLSYTPEVSHYKKATVLSVDVESKDLELKLFEESMLVSQGDGNIGSKRFELEDEEVETKKSEEEEIVSLNLHDLVEPRLLS